MRDEDYRAFRRELGRCYWKAGVQGEMLFRLGDRRVADLWMTALARFDMADVVTAMNRVIETGDEFVPASVIEELDGEARRLRITTNLLRLIAKGDSQ